MKFDRKDFLTRIALLEEKIDEDRRELRRLYDYVAEIDEVSESVSRETYQEESDSWLTPKQVCERLNIGYTTFFEWVRKGKLPPGLYLGKEKRWRMSDIEAWKQTKQIPVIEAPRRRGRPSRVMKIGAFVHG